MRLTLDGLIPVPLADRGGITQSGLWTQRVEFDAGEYVFIQAPSGTGKTTLLHILYGLRRDYKGEVRWGSDAVAKLSSTSLAGLRTNAVSIIFQDMRLFPELTAWENLEIKRCLTNTVPEAKVSEWMGRLGIAEKRDSLASTLSYGEQQRLAIVRALLQPFEWLLMDEPFSHLDHANAGKAIELIEEVVAQRKAGLLLADLDENKYFNYTQTIKL